MRSMLCMMRVVCQVACSVESLCFSSRRRHTRCALVTGVQTCALPIYCWSLASESIMASIQTHNPRPQQGGLLAGFKIQRNVVAALFMREVLTRFGRHNIGFLWMFVEPMLFT